MTTPRSALHRYFEASEPPSDRGPQRRHRQGNEILGAVDQRSASVKARELGKLSAVGRVYMQFSFTSRDLSQAEQDGTRKNRNSNTQVQYAKKMPDVESIMQVWPEEFERALTQINNQSAKSGLAESGKDGAKDGEDTASKDKAAEASGSGKDKSADKDVSISSEQVQLLEQLSSLSEDALPLKDYVKVCCLRLFKWLFVLPFSYCRTPFPDMHDGRAPRYEGSHFPPGTCESDGAVRGRKPGAIKRHQRRTARVSCLGVRVRNLWKRRL